MTYNQMERAQRFETTFDTIAKNPALAQQLLNRLYGWYVGGTNHKDTLEANDFRAAVNDLTADLLPHEGGVQ